MFFMFLNNYVVVKIREIKLKVIHDIKGISKNISLVSFLISNLKLYGIFFIDLLLLLIGTYKHLTSY